jgi:hypothetical protein
MRPCAPEVVAAETASNRQKRPLGSGNHCRESREACQAELSRRQNQNTRFAEFTRATRFRVETEIIPK